MLPIATPTPEVTTERTAIHRDFYDLDSLIGELATPKEQINNSKPGIQSNSAEIENHEAEPVELMAPEIAAISGKAIAGTIDTVLSTGFGLYAKSNNPEKYEASEKQLAKLSDAWAAVAAKYNYRVEDSPWFHIIALNAGIYIPKFNESKNDRRFAEMNEKFASLQKLTEEMEARLKNVETKNVPS